jgi:hypothetical protein
VAAARLDLSRGGWIEASPFPRGYPAAAERVEAGAEDWALDADVWRRPGTPELHLRGVADDGHESASVVYGAYDGRGGAG